MWKHFFLRFAGAAAILLLVIAAFCAFTDPYDIYGAPRLAGFNATPYKSEGTERMTKPIQMNSRPIETLILGNSKADFALNPADWCALTGEQHVYNAALRDGRLGESRRLLAHAIETHPELHRVILAIDYESFRDGRRWQPGFDAQQADARHITPANLAKTLFSIDALRDSLLTWRENRRSGATHPVYSPDGMFHAEVLHEIFGQEDDPYLNLQLVFTARREHAVEDRSAPYEDLAAIRDLCAAHGIELLVVVPPVQPLQVAAYFDDLEDYAAWMKRTAAIVPFLDATLAPGSEDPADYWDTAHMKASLGTRLLRTLAGQGDGTFGRFVTAATADVQLAWQQAALTRWRAAHPESTAVLAITGGWSETLPEGDVVQETPLDASTWERLTAPCDGELLRTGELPLRTEDVSAIYAVLETPDGRTLYHRAQKNRANDIARQELLHDIRRDPCRYLLIAPMPQNGKLRLMILQKDGTVYLTQVMESFGSVM